MQATAHPYRLPEQPELFDPERWPRRPYCTDDFQDGVRIRSLKQALTKRYLQANPPSLRVWSIYDIDRAGGALAWEDANLPPPSWITSNRENRHAHIVYGLDVPVMVGDAARLAPIRYLHGLESAYTEKLGADRGYSGLITKNPAHSHWQTFIFPVKAYTLKDLADCIEDFDKFIPKPNVKVAEVGLGRNLTVFYDVSAWAYKTIRNYRNERDGYDNWLNAVIVKCGQRNAEFSNPLPNNELRHIAKSLSKWVWSKFDIAASDARFSKLQSFRGKQQSNFMGAIHDIR
ncbi:MAG: replication initiation protein [Methylococcaceae bacterium]